MSTTPTEPASPPPSMLLAAHRALDEPVIKARIGAAITHVARQKVAAGKAALPNVTHWNYAVRALMNPTSPDTSMLALVTSEPGVAEDIKVNADGWSVNTSAVTDAEIISAVNTNWALVAAKYTADPFATSA